MHCTFFVIIDCEWSSVFFGICDMLFNTIYTTLCSLMSEFLSNKIFLTKIYPSGYPNYVKKTLLKPSSVITLYNEY